MDGADLKTAYMLIVHKNPEQVNMFIRQLLADEQADIYIHIDKKSIGWMAEEIIADPRVIKTSENILVTWGDVSMVEAEIALLKEVMDSGKKYDFVCMRTGQDLMVKKGYKEYLAARKGKSFFSMREITLKDEQAGLFKVKYPECTRRLYDSMHPCRIIRTGLRKLYAKGINLIPNNKEFDSRIKLFWGSDWFCASFGMAEYMVDYLEKNQWYLNAFKDSLAPSTMFFSTLAMNSPFADDVANEDHTYLRFGTTYKTNNHPMNFTMNEIGEIEKSERYFARKFDSSLDKAVGEYFLKKIIT